MKEIQLRQSIKVDLTIMEKTNMDNMCITIERETKIYSFKVIIKMTRDMDMEVIMIIRSR